MMTINHGPDAGGSRDAAYAKWRQAIVEEQKVARRLPRPNKRGVLRELNRVLPILDRIAEQLRLLHHEIWNLAGYDEGTFPLGTIDRFERAWRDVTRGIGAYNLDHAVAGHILRLTAGRSRFEQPGRAYLYGYGSTADPLNQFELRSSLDLCARTEPIVRIVRSMLAVIDDEVLPQRQSVVPERLHGILSWRSELADLLTIGTEALELMARLRLAEERLRLQSSTFRFRRMDHRDSHCRERLASASMKERD